VADQNLGPCVLDGRFVRLEPLRRRHATALTIAAGKLDWGWALSPLRSRKDVDERIKHSIRMERRNQEYVFAVRLKKEDRVVGSTAYFGIVPAHKRAEIGYTWYEQTLWGTYVNPESKFLLLRHAFDDWHAVRMQLTTDARNIHSQRAILKLGATLEGKLRNHGIRPDGSLRDAMMYSITSDDWPRVKSDLRSRIAAYSEEK
jgi:RimJ/RimL family protein N-acetyltransferase